jgi:hypothetical protein
LAGRATGAPHPGVVVGGQVEPSAASNHVRRGQTRLARWTCRSTDELRSALKQF